VSESAVPILPSRDLRETLAFYERLGFENSGAPWEEWDYLIVRRGEIWLHFFPWPDVDPLTTSAMCYLYVEDADAVHRQAVAAGGISVTEVTHLFFGDRVGRVRDPLGNLYWIQTRVEDLSPQEMEHRLGDPEFTKAMEYVQSADFFPGRASDLS